ncbi:magnesium/cobalt transporter CorA [Acetobacter nitrogenifigens DSM 23921 = NBRC 105050]|uniref:Magnesium transport protein CorA n=1 Tax=Acetobacter nitrogenifigens DSM 23921 = NBRC 105050 TaxID=1120919 RepID=A0A511XAN3_9PROT|nr:magnesium transporter CorA family protein [Acetobacter nitrogenifigens]GBQ91131.1 magnesium/cobalt transporter CorA [Acetobacter nitrogenifigens DSM 23921 = NBRC 105050]GEN59985.1 magnesium transport protein CorA [Acetobacter nitrogenifigens DSM 23921 = NBRC 105050]
MFLAHKAGQPARTVANEEDARDADWLDLVDPTPAEHALASRIAGVAIPERSNLEEIESSSRLFTRDEAVYMSTPLVRRTDTEFYSSPIGFVLLKNILVTIRFLDYASFDVVARQVSGSSRKPAGDELMVMLMEAIVDRLADALEHVTQSLSRLSRDVFTGKRPRAGRMAAWQREILRRVGHSEDLSSLIRDSLMGLDRIAIFISESAKDVLSDPLKTRMATVNRDISSLNDFVAQLANKVQFLLDAALGFISIEQNDGMKILTVVSFIGVAPTLVAGVYGMNFKDIPELQWSFGYWYALGLMAASIVVPLLWFWRRGWLGGVR